MEELFSQAVEVKALNASQEIILKNVFYQGLRQPLKQCGNLKYETITDYDKFKIEMRKIESDLEVSSAKEKESAKCNAVNQRPDADRQDMKEMKDMLKAMNEKINSLEQKQEQQQFMPIGAGGYRGPRHFRGNYNKREVRFKEEEDSTDLIGLQDHQHLDQLLHLTTMRRELAIPVDKKVI